VPILGHVKYSIHGENEKSVVKSGRLNFSLLLAQLTPLNPLSHLHVYESLVDVHVPPLLQVCPAHLSTTVGQYMAFMPWMSSLLGRSLSARYHEPGIDAPTGLIAYLSRFWRWSIWWNSVVVYNLHSFRLLIVHDRLVVVRGGVRLAWLLDVLVRVF